MWSMKLNVNLQEQSIQFGSDFQTKCMQFFGMPKYKLNQGKTDSHKNISIILFIIILMPIKKVLMNR